MGSGIITANNYEQALSRSKISNENYGGRAADACHKLLSLIYE
jgi:6,7-dimethyl-8-ribityllumazine synthase